MPAMVMHVCPNPWAPDSVATCFFVPWMGGGGRIGAENFSFLLALCPDFLQIKADPRHVPTLHDWAVLLVHFTV